MSRGGDRGDIRAAALPPGFIALVAVPICLSACGLGDGLGPDTEPEDPFAGTAVIGIDEGHFNGHTANGGYAPFARLLRDHGHLVERVTGEFRRERLGDLDVLVIANALHPDNVNDWRLPTPSAFAPDEIDTVAAWVQSGGGLLLIADHMPFPGAAAELAQAFGVSVSNGFAFDPSRVSGPKPCLAEGEIDIFRRGDGSLSEHAITLGRTAAERVDSVATFTGHAFLAPEAEPILRLGPGWRSLLPEGAWAFPEGTPTIEVSGWLQGAVLRHGSGRVAFFGEAGMFSEQTCDGTVPHGMNAPVAVQNAQFVLNTIHWLAGYLDPG